MYPALPSTIGRTIQPPHGAGLTQRSRNAVMLPTTPPTTAAGMTRSGSAAANGIVTSLIPMSPITAASRDEP